MRSVLVVNSGSSSLKYQVVSVSEHGDTKSLLSGAAQRIGHDASRLVQHVAGAEPTTHDAALPDHATALAAGLQALRTSGLLEEVAAVGHRVTHGGDRFTEPVLVTDDVLREIAELDRLAPLHNPTNREGLEVLRRHLPGVPHVAVFDTAFHAGLPPVATTYALPADLASRLGLRRYGFHGSSVAYVTRRTARLIEVPSDEVNLIVCHLGNGASVTAIAGGRSVDTSMGMTPLEGLVMGTRSGDLDPSIVVHLARSGGMSLEEIDETLNRRSGLLGLCGHSDVRTARELAESGDDAAAAALELYGYRIQKYLAAYLGVLSRLDAVVFTGGVGENDAVLRAAVCRRLEHLGFGLDEEANAGTRGQPATGERRIDDGSGLAIWVVPTDEESEIARETVATLSRTDAG